MPSLAPRVLEQLGYGFGYASDGNGGPAVLGDLAWGRHAAATGSLGAAVPLFPRLDVESAAT